jgi:predicted RNA-binding Zn ribbon-like protein
MPLSRAGRGTGWALAVDIVNTWDEYPRPTDLVEGIEDVRPVLAWHGLPGAAAAVEPGDVERFRLLRTRLEEVFDAGTEDDAVALLNTLLVEYGVPPQLERDGRRWRFRAWPNEREGLRAGAALAAYGLLDAVREHGWSRLGRCAGSPCRCVYVDRTRNRSRRYCSVRCADRVAQANLRTRRKAASKNSNRNEGTRSLTTNAVGIRRQAGRGADGCCAVDRFGRTVGAARAAFAEGGAAFPLSGP